MGLFSLASLSYVASAALSFAHEWSSSHSLGEMGLAIILILWTAHIVKQLVRLLSVGDSNRQVPQDPTKPPVIFHFFPWVGSMVAYGMEPYKFFNNARAKVSAASPSL